jgi:hypothetical protein
MENQEQPTMNIKAAVLEKGALGQLGAASKTVAARDAAKPPSADITKKPTVEL